ncbi:hypothetical protein QVD17_19067 [Tagetes erecta]|uniref:Retrovirus-related Pol polyprotein from transposon TNT 1-94-like beta-barrel domain-containing protein n=1 Tax=Tagetes erecta TaxID=13708 RepID=A0AAD8KJ82_TARER|nr:hypothetical protein QVD17_19067 [Tagetes erecta]
MDSGASFHATHRSDGMRNVKKGDFGKARLVKGEILDVTGMGDVDLRLVYSPKQDLKPWFKKTEEAYASRRASRRGGEKSSMRRRLIGSVVTYASVD